MQIQPYKKDLCFGFAIPWHFLGSSVKCMDVNLNLRVKTLNKGWHFVSLYKPKKKNT